MVFLDLMIYPFFPAPMLYLQNIVRYIVMLTMSDIMSLQGGGSFDSLQNYINIVMFYLVILRFKTWSGGVLLVLL